MSLAHGFPGTAFPNDPPPNLRRPVKGSGGKTKQQPPAAERHRPPPLTVPHKLTATRGGEGWSADSSPDRDKEKTVGWRPAGPNPERVNTGTEEPGQRNKQWPLLGWLNEIFHANIGSHPTHKCRRRRGGRRQPWAGKGRRGEAAMAGGGPWPSGEPFPLPAGWHPAGEGGTSVVGGGGLSGQKGPGPRPRVSLECRAHGAMAPAPLTPKNLKPRCVSPPSKKKHRKGGDQASVPATDMLWGGRRKPRIWYAECVFNVGRSCFNHWRRRLHFDGSILCLRRISGAIPTDSAFWHQRFAAGKIYSGHRKKTIDDVATRHRASRKEGWGRKCRALWPGNGRTPPCRWPC